jgi:hypothetical protein
VKTSLALAAATLVAIAAPAAAKTSVISLNGHCDVITLQIKQSLVAGMDDPGCSPQYGGGMIGKVKNFGGAIVAGILSPNTPDVQYVIQIAYPLVTGGAWTLYSTSDGVSIKKLNSGTYTVEGTADKGNSGTRSVFAHR